MARQSKLFNWVIFAVSIGLLGFMLWIRLFSTPPRGEWREQLAGARLNRFAPLDSLPVVDTEGRHVELSHPAVFYFYSSNCKFCPPAAARINAFVAAHGSRSLPIYALSNYGRIPPSSAEMFAPSIRLIRLTRTTPRLTFVKEVPLLVRTDASGRIQHAYVGIAADTVLAAMLMPREAGPVAR
jgi:thiol-disulfide isomerase/thioredoxin